MDLSQETNVEKLKALAFDELRVLEQAQHNLQLINKRISELEQEKNKSKD